MLFTIGMLAVLILLIGIAIHSLIKGNEEWLAGSLVLIFLWLSITIHFIN